MRPEDANASLIATPQARTVIGIVTASNTLPEMPLFDWLAGVFSVRFQIRRPGCWDGLDAVILLDLPDAVPGLACLKMAGQVQEPIQQTTVQVQFSTSETVPHIFRGRLLEQEELGAVGPLKLEDSDRILATISGQPVWAVRQHGRCRTDCVGFSLPKFEEARSLFQYFEGFNFFRLLPFIEFLRRQTGQDQWSSPQLQACFMFDDPNLHGLGYGWLDYRKLAAHAGAHHYHVSMATIPLDTWRTNQKAVEIYAKHKERLSLLFHGNDHLHKELARFGSEERALQSLAQALKRVAKLERNYEIQIPRVMAAPHGACSEESLRAMARVGFEAATLSCGAFRASNPQESWSKQIGLRVADVIAGLPTFGRFRFKYGNRFALLAAYLNQPIIPYGHHRDVAGGLEVLEDLAHFINSLGHVRWTDMGSICRSNYLVRRQGTTLRVHSYARVLHVPIPDGVTEAAVERLWVGSESEGLRIRVAGQADHVFPTYAGEIFPVKSGGLLEARFLHPQTIGPETLVEPGWNLWAFARRQFCEARDRLGPLLPAKNGKQ